jgi:hypothetical protein
MGTSTQRELFLKLLCGLFVGIAQKVGFLAFYHLLDLLPILLSIMTAHESEELYPFCF